MKIRNGFVTNSSSSNFVLSFRNKRQAISFFRDNPSIPDTVRSYMISKIEMQRNVGRKKLREYIFNELCGWCKIEKFLKSKDFSEESLSDTELETLNKKTDEIVAKMENNYFNVIVEVEDHSPEGSMLESQILPNINQTVVYFNHH